MQAVTPEVQALLKQAIAMRHAGDMANSAELLQQAAASAPDNANIQYDTALTWLHLGQPAKALPGLQRAVALNPRFGSAHLQHGLVLQALSLPGPGEAYQQAITAMPDLVAAYPRLAAVRIAEGRHNEAISLYQQAARRTPDHQAARIYQARAALLRTDLETAENLLRQVLTVDGDAYEALSLLAYIQKVHGHFAGAEASLTRALQLRPSEIDLYHALVHTRKIRADDTVLIGRMREALSWIAPDAVKARLHLALAKALDDVGDYSDAAFHLQAASDLQAKQCPFDRKALVAQVDRLIRLLTVDRLRQPDPRRNTSDRPILVLGMPRSGTTLTEQILSCHPMVAGGGELAFWSDRGRAFLHTHYTDALDTPAIADNYLALLRSVSATAERVVDKNPFNFTWAGLIHFVFPNARIIHCRRNPSDTCLSALLADISQPQFPHAVADLAFYYQQYQRLMAHCRSVLPHDRFLDLDYEKLVEDPATQIPSLIAFCGLPWNEACLAPERNSRAILTASLWQARQPIYRSSTGRRRHYEALLRPFEALAGEG